jgi:hypothetical protein
VLSALGAGDRDHLMVVVVGDVSQTARVCRRELGRLPSSWRLVWIPRTPGELVAGLHGGRPAPGTVIWLEDLRQYLFPADPELGEQAAAGLRGALLRPQTAPLLVLGTLPVDPQQWRQLREVPASGGRDRRAQARALLHSAMIVSSHPAIRQEAGITLDPSFEDGGGPPGGPAGPGGELAEGRPDVWSGSPAAAGPVPPSPAAAGPVPPSPAAAGPAPPPAAVRSPTGEAAGRPLEAHTTRRLAGPVPTAPAVPETPQALRERARLLEAGGDLPAAERLYERAAIGGDLEALSHLGRLRDSPGSEQDRDTLYGQAVAERNTGVMFCLAAAGHPGAARTLALLRAQAARPDAALEPVTGTRTGSPAPGESAPPRPGRRRRQPRRRRRRKGR